VRTLACIIVAIFVVSIATAGRPQPARAAAQPYGVEMPPGLAHTSAASCSASACHGGGQPGKPGSEHTSWAPDLDPRGEHDPHSKAYRVLFNAESVRIAKLTGGGLAHENVLCLKCHAPSGVANPAARAEGVGCSACHGPSEKWIDSHYLPEWKTKTNREKWSEGFVPSKNLTARISNCATCHVGSVDREVNHDLIAAGHPRLAFEYTRFHFSENYRKHWDEKTPQPDFEVRAWVIGQAATARAAVDVLHGRAVRAKENKAPWPEFAGFSCYACHQTIGDKHAKGRSDPPIWESFHTATVEFAAGRTFELFTPMKHPSLEKYKQLKRLMDWESPKPAQVEPLAAAARNELDVWLLALQQYEESGPRPLPARTPARIATILSVNGLQEREWDALAQNHLGCVAMYHAGGGSKALPTWAQPIESLRDALRFPGKGLFNSPAGFDDKKRTLAREKFIQIRDVAIEEANR
jgi:hypothetical protein